MQRIKSLCDNTMYGGTKSEMERLIKDAAAMTDIQEDLNISVEEGSLSFANIVNAIHVMQTSLGIAGATSQEAKSTISGSIAAMKGAWSNLKVGVATNSEEMGTLIDNFVDATTTAGENIINRATTVIEGLKNVFSDPEKRQKFVELGKQLLSKIGDGIKILLGIEEGESPIGAAKRLLSTLIDKLREKAPDLFDAGKELFKTLLAGIMDMEESDLGFARVTGWLTGTIFELLSDAATTAWDLLVAMFSGDEFDSTKFNEEFLAGMLGGSETLRNSGQFSSGYNPDQEPEDITPWISDETGLIPKPGRTPSFIVNSGNETIKGAAPTVGNMVFNITPSLTTSGEVIGEIAATAVQEALEELEAANG